MIRFKEAPLVAPGDEPVTPPEPDRLVNGAHVTAAGVQPDRHTTEPSTAVAQLPAPWPGSVRARAGRRANAWSLFDGSTGQWLRAAVDLLVTMGLTAALVAGERGDAPGLTHAQLLWTYPLLVVAVMALRGNYSRLPRPSVIDAVGSAIVSASLATAVYVTVTAFAYVDTAQLPLVIHVSAAALAGTAILTAIHQVARRWGYQTGRIGRRALIVGGGAVGTKIAARLFERPEYGLVPVAMLDHEASKAPGGPPVPVVGTPEELVEAAAAIGVDHVILAFSRAPDRVLVDHVRRCEAAGLEVSVVPRFFESMVERVQLQRIGVLPLMALRSVHPNGWQFGVKYGLDRVIALVLIVLLAPLLLLAAAAVRLTSSGPVLFRQRRVGRDGQVFDLLKFRSMRHREDGPGFEPFAGLAPGGIEGPDRRTAVGRVIRRTFIDELPQLFNVIRGEMSLIGPRPERPEFVAMFANHVDRYGDRHRVRSGITGWAQVNGLRGQTSLADRVELDNHYIDNWSFTLDVKILLLTLVTVLSAHGKD